MRGHRMQLTMHFAVVLHFSSADALAAVSSHQRIVLRQLSLISVQPRGTATRGRHNPERLPARTVAPEGASVGP